MSPRHITGVVLAAAMLTGVAACSGSPQAPGSATPKDTSAAAPSSSDTSSIVLYTSEPQNNADAIVKEFNKVHPEITVTVFRAGTGDLKARIDSERAAGDVQADVILAADAATFEGFKANKLLKKYTPQGADKINKAFVDPEGYYTGTHVIPTIIAYNTTAVTKAPTSWKDLTDPSLKDKIVMPDPAVSGAAAFNAAVWMADPQLGKSWMEGVAANKPEIARSNGPVSQAVAAGSRPYGVVVDFMIRKLADKGSPVAAVYPSEGVPFVAEPVGIVATTKHDKAAEAFADFLLSEQGQKQAVEQGYLPVREDVGTPKGAPELKDIKLMTPELSTIMATQKDAVATFNELFK